MKMPKSHVTTWVKRGEHVLSVSIPTVKAKAMLAAMNPDVLWCVERDLSKVRQARCVHSVVYPSGGPSRREVWWRLWWGDDRMECANKRSRRMTHEEVMLVVCGQIAWTHLVDLLEGAAMTFTAHPGVEVTAR